LAVSKITTTTTTTTQTQTGTKLSVDSAVSTQTVGNFVTDVSLNPYIASRVISFYAYNMRPNQRMHIFFDSINVDSYCAPGERSLVPSNTIDYRAVERIEPWGNPIYSDQYGVVAGQFNIPAKTFKTGDRLLQISDVDSLVLGNNAFTTIASASFTASNLSVTKQGVTLTTVNPEVRFIPVSNTVTTTEADVVTDIQLDFIPDVYNFTASAWEPIAQALTINTPQDQSGIFATSLDLYFKQKAQVADHGITIYLCETDNGYPNGSAVLPYSRVHLTRDEVNTSTDATVSTKFTFSSPIFLSNKKTYAFVVKPDANDPDYHVYSANLGDSDLTTGRQVFSQPIIGTAFYGATESQWTALQTEYIKFKLNRAKFLNANATAVFYNTNTDFISLQNINYANTSASVLPGDYIYESSNSTANSTGGTVNTSVYAVVDRFDDVTNIVYADLSTGNFTPNTYMQIHRFANNSIAVRTPNNTTLIAYGNTGSLYNPTLNAVVPKFAYITPPGTSLNLSYIGTSNTYTIDSTGYRAVSGFETEFLDKERIVASRSNEVDNMSGNKSMTFNAEMSTDTEYLSPVIDTVRYQELLIKNDIDPIEFKYNEFFNSGNTKSKYVSQIVTLAPGQDAQDLQIILSAYRPLNTDIQVWVKVINGEDTRSISQQTWAPLYNDSTNMYSDSDNPDDFREYVFKFGSFYRLLSTNGTVTIANSSSTLVGTSTVFQVDVQPGWFVNMRAGQQLLKNATPFGVYANTTGFNAANNVLFINNAGNYVSVNNRIYYEVPTNNTAIASLTGNSWYYVTYSNTTAISLALTDGGANVDITDSRTTNPAETHLLYVEKPIFLNEQSREIMSISSNTSLTISAPFVGNYTAQPYFLVPPPTTAWLSSNTQVKLSGTVTAYSTNNFVSGSGTSFTTEVIPGSVLTINNDSQQVVSVINSTALTVGTIWTSNATGANAYITSKAGVTYLNSDLNLYSGFKQFQIKIVLQSNDSSKVPLLDDLRVLALQL